MNAGSRTALVVMLVAAEIVIAGIALYTVRGTHAAWAGGPSSSMPATYTLTPIAAGGAPRVEIDDPESLAEVTISNDGLVHVQDLSSRHGWFFTSPAPIPRLTAERTLAGVRISRPKYDSGTFGVAFDSEQRIAVQVPAGAHLALVECSGADVTGIQNGVEGVSQDGHIGLTDVRGDVSVRSDDGHIDATRVTGNNVSLATADGSMHLRDVVASQLVAKTNDGRIEAYGLRFTGSSAQATIHSDDGSVHVSGLFAAGGTYDVTSGDGRVELALERGSDATVDASTADGSLSIDGQRAGDGDSQAQSIRVGNGSSRMRARSEDGSVHVITNGAL